MAVMTMVFSGYSPGKNTFPVYFLTGHTFYTLFTIATTTSMSAFEDNKNLFQKSKLPREIFVLSRDYTALVNMGFSCIALLCVLVFFRIVPNWTITIFLCDVVCTMIFTIGVSFVLATIYVFYKDIKFLWGNFIILLRHTIALFVPIEKYPDFLQKITRKNPMFFYPNIARKCILEGTYDVNELKQMVVWAVLSLIIGLGFFKLNENKIVKKI